MIRMIKKENTKVLYWQVWVQGKQVFAQAGTLGVSGEQEEVPRKLFESPKKVMSRLAKEKAYQGYEYMVDEVLKKVLIQFRCDEKQYEETEEKSVLVEDLLDDALFSTGIGSFYGSEFGDGGGTSSYVVINVDLAFETIVKELSTHRFIDDVEIAYINEDGKYISLYPEGAVFEMI